MNNEAQNIIEKQLAILPHDIRQAILSSSVQKNILAVGQAHHLHVDSIQKLSDSTYFVLLGLMHTKEFLQSLQGDLGLSRDEATLVAADVDRQILSPVRHSLLKMQQAMEEADRTEDAKSEPKQEILTTAGGNTVPIPTKLIEESQQSTVHAGPIPNIRTMPKDIARIKMGESIRLPKEEIAMNYKADPYREAPE